MKVKGVKRLREGVVRLDAVRGRGQGQTLCSLAALVVKLCDKHRRRSLN